jgi:hypothetical protein
VAEQNSVDVGTLSSDVTRGQPISSMDNASLAVDLITAWNLLMDFGFKELRMAIYSNQDELNRFRQLIVNTVMATDIMDKDLKALRNARWDKAFLKEPCVQESSKDIVDRKATIVIEQYVPKNRPNCSDQRRTQVH